MSYNETLERQYLQTMPQQGKVEWIGIRPKRLLEVHSVDEVQADPDTGLEGDHFKKSSTGKRIKVHLQKKFEGLLTVIGNLKKCDDETICILSDTNGSDMVIPYSLILKANLEPLLKF